MAGEFLSGIGSLLGSSGGIGGLLGGGDTKVSQSSTNSTSVNLTSLLSNQGQGDPSATASGSSSGSAQSASGSDAPLLPAPYNVPVSGFDSIGAEDAFKADAEPTAVPKTVIYAAGAVVAALGLYSFFGKKKKR